MKTKGEGWEIRDVSLINFLINLTGTHGYSYDSVYQLIQAAHPNIETESFTYDKTGNRITETRGAQTINYTHTAGNRIETRDGETYTHDKNGNIISITTAQGTTTYEYDYENRLKKATMPDGTVAEYKYDALWRRIEKAVTANNTTTITRYLYDGVNILAEYDENNAMITTYVHNISIDDPLAMERNNQTYFYHKDVLGSITAITDNTGQIAQTYEYDSFGNIIYIHDPNFKQPYTYTGREYDEESGLYYYRARYYDAQIGRFISEDPIGLAGGVNLYSYVAGDPVNWIDPYGLQATTMPTPYGPMPMPIVLPPNPQHNRLTPGQVEEMKEFFRLFDPRPLFNYLYETAEEFIERVKKEYDEKMKQCKTETGEPSEFPGPDPNKPPEDPKLKWKLILAQLLKLLSKISH